MTISTDAARTRAAASAQAGDHLQVVAFKLGGEHYAVEIAKVKEVILVSGVTKVPQMPAYLEGIINLRGNVIPVIDLRKRFELADAAYGEQTRIVVTRMGGRVVGIVVDAVSQVLKLPRAHIEPPPATIAGLAGEYLVGIARHGERMVILLDIERILDARERSSLRAVGESAERAPAATQPP